MRPLLLSSFSIPLLLASFHLAASPVLIKDKDGIVSSNHFDVHGALGVSSLQTNRGILGVTNSETDILLHSNNRWETFSAQLGLGYVYYLAGAQQYSHYTQWFPAISPQLNAYYIGGSNLVGDVWQFGDPALNNLYYKMPLHSVRLMADAELTVVSRQALSLNVLGGIGPAWNRGQYADYDQSTSPCVAQHLDLNAATTSNFAWEAGAGIDYAFNHVVSLSLDYVYADLGKVKTAASGNTGNIVTPVIVPAYFNLASQSVLLGLHVAF